MSRLTLGLALAALLAFPAASAAQQAASPAQRRAERIHQQAIDLQVKERRLVPAARMFVKEANVRGNHDPLAIDCLTHAADLYFLAGHFRDARFTMELAAAKAAGRDDPVTAADRYVRAAWMAKRADEPTEARRLLHQANVLAESPKLALAVRDSIRAVMGLPIRVGAH